MNNNIIDIVEIPIERGYWFIRTDGGDNFETYLEHEFISIGWNDITWGDIKVKTEVEVKTKIANSLGLKRSNRAEKQRVTDIYNKIKRFLNLKQGDIVVIPSKNSDFLAFGYVLEDDPYMASKNEFGCEHTKRRKIKWLTEGKNIDKLDPTFYKIKKSRHSISDIKQYEYYINSVLYNLYEKNGETHFVIKISTEDPINLKSLSHLLADIQELMQIVNDELSLEENVDISSIRLNLQSPGLLNFRAGKALIFVALLIGATGCSKDKLSYHKKNKLETITVDSDELLKRIGSNLDSMGARY